MRVVSSHDGRRLGKESIAPISVGTMLLFMSFSPVASHISLDRHVNSKADPSTAATR